MATYRPVDTRIWSDRKFLSLSDDGRILWLFLLTTSFHKSIPGVIVAGEAALAEDLGWIPERFRKGFAELFAKGMGVAREGRLIWLKNAFRYQPIAGPNSVKGMAKIWDDVPECSLKHELWQALKVACKSWDKLFAKGFREPFPEPSPTSSIQDQEQDQEQDQDQEQEEESASPSARSPSTGLLELRAKVNAATGDIGRARARKQKPSEPTADERASAMFILRKLSERSGVAYSGSGEHVRTIVARLREGITEADMRKVIGYCAVELEWQDDPKWSRYLRPKTLFGAQKIHDYLDPARTWFEKNGLSLDERPRLEVVP